MMKSTIKLYNDLMKKFMMNYEYKVSFFISTLILLLMFYLYIESPLEKKVKIINKNVKGINGVIKQYDEKLENRDIELNIAMDLQIKMEDILDYYKVGLGAKEVIASVMESDTGKILALATSNRFNPEHIKQSDVDNGYLSVNAIEYPFEPGSVIKPLSISLALDHGLVQTNEIFKAYNEGPKNKKGEYKKGAYKIGRFTIHDDHQFKKKWLTLDDIVIFSSNIGTLMLAQRLSGEQFYNGFKKFGLSKKTGIDLPYEKTGMIHKLYQYKAGESKGKDNIFKATDSYGQGITSTFMQVLKAYSVFNNDGLMITPQVVKAIEKDGAKIFTKPSEIVQVLKPSTANTMKKLLIKTVNEGTGTAAKMPQFEIGGKTGTANIPENGRYVRKYNSSFFGFVNGKKKKYTIGVTVREPISRGKYWYYYYASNSAVPVFKEIVTALSTLRYIKPRFSKEIYGTKTYYAQKVGVIENITKSNNFITLAIKYDDDSIFIYSDLINISPVIEKGRKVEFGTILGRGTEFTKIIKKIKASNVPDFVGVNNEK